MRFFARKTSQIAAKIGSEVESVGSPGKIAKTWDRRALSILWVTHSKKTVYPPPTRALTPKSTHLDCFLCCDHHLRSTTIIFDHQRRHLQFTPHHSLALALGIFGSRLPAISMVGGIFSSRSSLHSRQRPSSVPGALSTVGDVHLRFQELSPRSEGGGRKEGLKVEGRRFVALSESLVCVF